MDPASSTDASFGPWLPAFLSRPSPPEQVELFLISTRMCRTLPLAPGINHSCTLLVEASSRTRCSRASTQLFDSGNVAHICWSFRMTTPDQSRVVQERSHSLLCCFLNQRYPSFSQIIASPVSTKNTRLNRCSRGRKGAGDLLRGLGSYPSERGARFFQAAKPEHRSPQDFSLLANYSRELKSLSLSFNSLKCESSNIRVDTSRWQVGPCLLVL